MLDYSYSHHVFQLQILCQVTLEETRRIKVLHLKTSTMSSYSLLQKVNGNGVHIAHFPSKLP